MYQVLSEEPKIRSFSQLNAWKKAHELVLSVYRATDQFPRSEIFALSSQLRRASISISSNIAEGFSRRTKADKISFYHIALGSCTEVQNQPLIARDHKYITDELFDSSVALTIDVNKLTNGLIKSAEDKNI